MSPLGMFVLLLVAFVGTALVVSNPLYNVLKWSGKRQSEVGAAWNDATQSQKVEGCLKYGTAALLVVIYGWIVEPGAVIWALTRGIGSSALAWAMLALVILSWTVMVHRARRSSAQKTEADPIIPEVNRVAVMVERAVFALPTFYLWYLLLALLLQRGGG